MKAKIIGLAFLLLMTDSTAKMQKKQVNMGIVNPYEAKEKKSEFTKADRERAQLDKLKEQE